MIIAIGILIMWSLLGFVARIITVEMYLDSNIKQRVFLAVIYGPIVWCVSIFLGLFSVIYFLLGDKKYGMRE